MEIESGGYRTVFIFRYYVIKVPKTYKILLGEDYYGHKKYSWKCFLEGI